MSHCTLHTLQLTLQAVHSHITHCQLLPVGNYTLLNVFLAIAVDSLGQAQEMTALEEKVMISHYIESNNFR